MIALALIYVFIAVGVLLALAGNMVLNWGHFTRKFTPLQVIGFTLAMSLFWLPVLILIITANGKFRD